MAKQKGQKGKKSQKKQKPGKAKNTGKGSSKGRHGLEMMSYSMQVCSVTNPFCPEAIGARWPDNSYSKSVGWSITDLQAGLSCDASGNASMLIVPEGYYSSGTLAGTVSTNAATLVAFASWPANVVRYRITSWGFRLNSQLSPMTVAGMLRVRLFSPMNGSTLGTTSIVNNDCDNAYDIPLARVLNTDLHIIPSPLGDNARYFRDIADFNTTLASYKNPGWQIVQIAVNGAAASTVSAINVSVFFNFEFIFADADPSIKFAQPPPRNNPAVQQGSASVFASIGNFIEGAASKVDALMNSKAARLAGKVGLSMLTKNPAPMMIRDVD